jgi:phage tail-like protein
MAQRDVYPTYRFWVEIDSVTEATFSECSGLQAETEVVEWEEGGENTFRHRFLGRTKYPNLVLKRGVASAELWTWYDTIVHGSIKEGALKRRNLSVVLYGYGGMAQVRWNIEGALIVKWAGPTLKTGANETAVETIELAHHGLKRA